MKQKMGTTAIIFEKSGLYYYRCIPCKRGCPLKMIFAYLRGMLSNDYKICTRVVMLTIAGIFFKLEIPVCNKTLSCRSAIRLHI